MAALIRRNASDIVLGLLQSFRLVLLGGARQTGKTTLARDLLGIADHAWLSFDDEAVLANAEDDPVGFVESLPRPGVVDEFQRAGRAFLLAIKQRVDTDRARGQLLLTGSTNYLADRSVSETLAGRAGRISLWPLSVGERLGVRETFVDHLFSPPSWPADASAFARGDLVDLMLAGGFPEIVTEEMAGRRRWTWFDSYVRDVVSREALRPMVDVRLESELRHVLRLLAARTGQELVLSDLVADAGLARETVSNYVALLQALNLVVLVPAWATRLTTRAKRRPKIAIVDTGLAAAISGATETDFSPTANGAASGAIFETFVTTEMFKQATWSDRPVDVSHFRDRNGPEVDLVVEDRRTSQVAGVDVKFTSTPTIRHARHLKTLRDALGDRFTVGVVVHAGQRSLRLADRIWAVPVSALWRSDAVPAG